MAKPMKLKNLWTSLASPAVLSKQETHLVVVNDRLVTEDHRLAKDDRVKLIRVVSGG